LIARARSLERETKYDQARDVCNLILQISNQTGDAIGIASATLINGILNRDADNVDAAFKDFQASLALSESIHYKKGIAEARENLAWLKKDLGDFAAAMDEGKRSMELYQALGDKKGIGKILSLMGDISEAQSDHDKAYELYQQSLKVRQDLGDSAEIGKSYTRLGNVVSSLGNEALALEYLRKAESLFKEAGTKLDLAAIYNNMANSFQRRGQLSQALEYYLKTQRIAEEVGAKRWIALPTINLGVVHEVLGNYTVAMEYYQKALGLYEETGMKWYAAVALSNIAGIHALEGRYDKSLTYYQQALASNEGLGNKGGVAGILGNIAYVHEMKGEYQTAMEYCLKSLEQHHKLNEKSKIAENTSLLARIQRELKQYPEALESAGKAKDLALEQEWNEILWAALMEEGRAYRALDQETNALKAFQESVRVVESFRTGLPGAEIATQNFFQSRTEPYYDLIQQLILQNRIAEAFDYAELSKARVLLDVLERGKSRITKNMTEQEKEAESRLRSQLTFLNTELFDAKSNPTVDSSEIQKKLSKARIEFESFRTNLYAAHPELQIQRGDMKPVSVSEAMNAVKMNAAILEYVVTEDKVFLFVLKDGTGPEPILEAHSIDVPHKDLSLLAAKFRQQLADQDLEFRPLARQLYQLLIEPAEKNIQSVNSVIIIPHRELWELPFQALETSGGQYFIQTHAVSYAPSLTALVEMIKSQEEWNISPTLLALGNPLLSEETAKRLQAARRDEQLHSLPVSEEEVRALENLYGKGSRVYIRADAREDTFKAEASKYGVIHIAAHGIVNDVDPLYSFLALARDKQKETEDGLLEPWEILDLDLRAAMVVLSACESGRGKVTIGEGIIGFAWAFFVAGSPSTVVSQWKVDSVSTTHLIRDFHANWRQTPSARHLPKAEALRKAAMKLLKNKHYQHPFYWASFIVIGDPS